jgi:hypothetical protein
VLEKKRNVASIPDPGNWAEEGLLEVEAQVLFFLCGREIRSLGLVELSDDPWGWMEGERSN